MKTGETEVESNDILIAAHFSEDSRVSTDDREFLRAAQMWTPGQDVPERLAAQYMGVLNRVMGLVAPEHALMREIVHGAYTQPVGIPFRVAGPEGIYVAQRRENGDVHLSWEPLTANAH